MVRSLRIAALAALVWFGAGHSNAYFLPGEAPPRRLVEFAVAATDSRGQPVPGLTAAGFRVSDAGKAQPVAFVRHSDGQLRQPPALRPGEYSNRLAANAPHATLILFDMLNGGMSTQNSAADYLARALRSLESADCLYLYILTAKGRLFAVHALPGADGETPGPSGVPWTGNARPLLEKAINSVFQLRPLEMHIDERVRFTYRALERIGGALAGLPGRKSIVWITQGVPLSIGTGVDTIDYEPMLRRLCQTLDRAAISVYPVRLMGAAVILLSLDTLQRFAELTGGLKLNDDVSGTVRQAMSDVRNSYTVGYYPPAENWDGQFHKVRITCEHKGVRLRTKAGYYAVDEGPSGEQAALDGGFASPFDAAGIGIRGTASPGAAPAGAPGGRMTHFEFRIDAADVRLSRETDKYIAHLALQMAGIMPDGRTERLKVVPLDIALGAEEHAKALQDGIPFTRDILLGDAVKKVRLVVFDRGANRVGSLTIPLKAAGK